MPSAGCSSNSAIVLAGITKRFGVVTALDTVSFDVRRGEVFGLLGHNGAGKTTTVRLLNGILAPDSGAATVLGLSPTESGRELRRRTGVLTESATLEDRLTATENLEVYGAIYGLPSDVVRSRVRGLLADFDLADRSGDRVAAFSRGMRQRLALARVLLHQPELLFLDEPTSGLDPAATRQFYAIVRSLSSNEGRTVMMCTHNLHEAESLCDRFAVLRQGRLLAIGTAAELGRHSGIPTTVEAEVTFPPGVDVESAVRKAIGDRPMSWDDGTLRIDRGSRELAASVVSTVVAAGARVYGVRVSEPSLEDIYFALEATTEAEA